MRTHFIVPTSLHTLFLGIEINSEIKLNWILWLKYVVIFLENILFCSIIIVKMLSGGIV